MFKRMTSILLAVMCFLYAFPLATFAANESEYFVLDRSGHIIEFKDAWWELSLAEKLRISFNPEDLDWFKAMLSIDPNGLFLLGAAQMIGDLLCIDEHAKSLTQVESTSSGGPTGAGRRPTGYTDDGIPAIDTNGNLIVSVSHDYAAVKYWQNSYSEKLYYCSDSKRTSNLVLSDYSIALSWLIA